MKKIKTAVLSVILAVGTALSVTACDNQVKTTEEADAASAVVFSTSSQKTEINPLIYGQFIEHIETCIYDGIWSEIVLDRKFYYEVGLSGLSPWRATNGDKVSSDTEVTLSGGHSAKISAGGGISQQKLSFAQEDYTGYFWCDSAAGCKVKITVSQGADSASVVVDVPAGSGFSKHEYALSCGFRTLKHGSYTFEVLSGEGYFDSLSLMPADNYKGMRRDTLDELKELDSPMYRWPGGNFLSGYDWEDGVGNVDERPSRRNLNYMGPESDFDNEDAQIASDMVKLNQLGFYGGIEPNDYGLDEFMAMCEYLGTEPLMMVNTGLGTAEQAAAQLQYCNGSVNTEYGAKRAANGHAEPYGIKYWGVGNEMYGSWQLGNVPLADYVKRHNEFANALKAEDDSVYLIASGNNASSWSDGLFKNCAGNFDFIAEHMYGKRDEADVFQHLKNMKTNIDGRIANHRNLLEKYPAQSDVKIAFTEYAYSNVECASRLKDGMGIGEFLNSVIKNADVFELCCYSSTVNATQGCVTTDPLAAVTQGAGYVLKLYHDYMQSNMIAVNYRFDKDLQLDMSLSVSSDGKTLSLAVVNPSTSAVELTNTAFGEAKNIERHTLTGDYYDSYNTTASDELHVEHKNNLSNAVAPAMSVSVFVIEL